MRELQPNGPYLIAGWCYGGIVAVEMAQQLLKQGEEVAFLGLLETVAAAPAWWSFSYYAHRLGCALSMKPAAWLRYIQEKIKYRKWLKLLPQLRFSAAFQGEAEGGPKDVQKLERLRAVYEANLLALRRYRSRPYPGRVVLFNAREQDPGLIPDPLYGWAGLAREIETHIVPGSHDTMLNEPNAGLLAAQLEACLDQFQSEPLLPSLETPRHAEESLLV
jgi:thioesterase domain-containing protein